ncbi:hypothetical protein OS493_038756, partial [Desmophyllum pertusum]
ELSPGAQWMNKTTYESSGQSFKFPSKMVTNVVYIEGALNRNLTAATVCVWMRSNDKSKGHFVSYALPNMYNALSLGNCRKLHIAINDIK